MPIMFDHSLHRPHFSLILNYLIGSYGGLSGSNGTWSPRMPASSPSPPTSSYYGPNCNNCECNNPCCNGAAVVSTQNTATLAAPTQQIPPTVGAPEGASSAVLAPPVAQPPVVVMSPANGYYSPYYSYY
jgi:hypothetical protein